MTPEEKKQKVRKLKSLARLEDRLTSLKAETRGLKHMIECLEEFKINVAHSTYEDLQKTIDANQKEIDALVNEELSTNKSIRALKDPYEKKVIIFRYVDCLSWEAIMKKMRYSRTQVNRIHNKAIENIVL